MEEKKDYTLRMWALLLSSALLLICLYYLPTHIGSWELKPVDMLSEIRIAPTDSVDLDNPEDLLGYSAGNKSEVNKKKTPHRDAERDKPTVTKQEEERREALWQQNLKQSGIDADSTFVAIDDDHTGRNSLKRFFSSLTRRGSLGRPVRIAVLGDSFIEGDIFTAPLRNLLQGKYGGAGVGWMPLTSQTAGFRTSIRHEFEGWTDKSVLSSAKSKQVFSGHYFVPREGAWVRYTLPQGATDFGMLTLYYTAEEEAKVSLHLQDTILPRYLDASVALRSLKQDIEPAIRGAKITFSEVKGLSLYGVAIEHNSGVSLDNMSLRGSSGMNILSIDEELTKQFVEERPYDLIILQYGLNVANAKQKDYSNYAKTLRGMISKLRSVAPNTDILIMGVSDRAKKTAQGLETMQSIFYLHKTQQEVAQEMHCAFWSSLKAMRALGGISDMASRGEAAKDYTHLTHKGGTRLAKQFMQALTVEKTYYDAVHQTDN